ncbi:glycosyltransferase [Cellulomonas olei]|uniref:glycosyltransferase n=1 Tax=Cellulomonas sp. P4 TaxID=3142533 RepID=UPI0031BAA378
MSAQVEPTTAAEPVAGRAVRLTHLLHLSTPSGLHEHALGREPRPEHGMCVDDVARALVLTARVPHPDAAVTDATDVYLHFIRQAQRGAGLLHNRRTVEGAWQDEPSAGDHWGRALWALGTAAAHLPPGPRADEALRGASEALLGRSSHPRATAYATLGAVEVLRAAPQHEGAQRLLDDARTTLPRPRTDPRWPWPEARLTYANAVLPEAMIAVAEVVADDGLLDAGVRLLSWLVTEQTVDEHLSVVPAGGRGPHDARPGFDQQPIEVAALAEAAATARRVTSDEAWSRVIERCVAWFEGANDTRVPVRDPETGGGFDGLERTGVNQNQGAESTLAWLACAQLAGPPAVRVRTATS